MNPFPSTPDLLEVAENVVWFKEPTETLNAPIHFLSYAMRYGTDLDLIALEKSAIGLDHCREALDHALAGVFDPRSWAYWNLKCGRTPPPLPVRNLNAIHTV